MADIDIKKLQLHLLSRPIAPIFANSKEQDDFEALKLMCMIDFYADNRELFGKINKLNQPKLLGQLIQLHSFKSFKYYNCHVNRAIGDRQYQCTFCELIAPYSLVLTHMAIVHDTHVSVKTCAYCKRESVVKHNENGTLDKCYADYLKKYNVDQIDDESVQVIIDFYKLLKDIAELLNVLISRNENMDGIGYPRIEQIKRKIPQFPTTFKVLTPKRSSKKMDKNKLDEHFNIVVSILFGGNRTSRLKRDNKPDVETFVISDDDSDINTTSTSPAVVKSEHLDDVDVTVADAPTWDATDEEAIGQVSASRLNSSDSCNSSLKSKDESNHNELFAKYVASRLNLLPSVDKQRKLEREILKSIVLVEAEEH